MESLKPIKQVVTIAKERFERKHCFNYIVERDLISKDVHNKKGIEDFVKEEFKNIGKVGFSRPKDYGKLLLKKHYNANNLENEGYIPRENPSDHYNWSMKDDIKYVKTLNNFEKRFLPDINIIKNAN